MSVLIKGMEMPKSCILCDLSHEDGWCPVKQDYVDRYSYETCPLIEIPPHGRLIDADAFCEKVLEIVERQKYDDFYAKSLSVGAILREVVRELRGKGLDGFDNAPTVIEAEEVYDKYTDTAGKLHWTGTHSGKHIVKV